MWYPPDIDAAYDAWGANCGPCSLAALLEKKVEEVRPYFAEFSRLHYVNPTHMKAALDAAGVRYTSVGRALASPGLLFLQWGGYADKPIREQYRHTHWVAMSWRQVFEVNAPALTSWDQWTIVMPELITREGRGDGTFFIRTGIQVHLT